jgi:hypothetical protein
MTSDPHSVDTLQTAFNEAKGVVEKAELCHKSYFGKDKDKQLKAIIEDPLKKIEAVALDLSICYN